MFKLILKILLFIILTPLVIFFGMYIAAPDGSEFIRKNPTTTALIRQRTAEYQKANKNVSIKWQWMPISKISPNIIHAVILAEDARFYEHNGFDVEAIKFALEKNRQRQRIRNPVRQLPSNWRKTSISQLKNPYHAKSES
jgi:monofunctional biosynthetic peptidoglycan transglycosylase